MHKVYFIESVHTKMTFPNSSEKFIWVSKSPWGQGRSSIPGNSKHLSPMRSAIPSNLVTYRFFTRISPPNMKTHPLLKPDTILTILQRPLLSSPKTRLGYLTSHKGTMTGLEMVYWPVSFSTFAAFLSLEEAINNF